MNTKVRYVLGTVLIVASLVLLIVGMAALADSTPHTAIGVASLGAGGAVMYGAFRTLVASPTDSGAQS